jgi:hypothetical protein
MTKSVRKASAWRSREVQSDPSGYARAQEAERADERAERERKADALLFTGLRLTDTRPAYCSPQPRGSLLSACTARSRGVA